MGPVTEAAQLALWRGGRGISPSMMAVRGRFVEDGVAMGARCPADPKGGCAVTFGAT